VKERAVITVPSSSPINAFIVALFLKKESCSYRWIQQIVAV